MSHGEIIRLILLFEGIFFLILSFTTSYYYIKMLIGLRLRDYFDRFLVRLGHTILIVILGYATYVAPHPLHITWITYTVLVAYTISIIGLYKSTFDLSAQYKEYKFTKEILQRRKEKVT